MPHWYNRALDASFCIVLTRLQWRSTPLMGAITAALLASIGPGAAAQGEAEPTRTTERLSTIGVDYSYAWFENTIDPWHMAALSLGHRRKSGSFMGRVNLARRFAENGAQAEVDAYPSLGAHTYAYLNTGYSRSAIFPEWRFGGEVFHSLARSFEASLGFRQLRFGGPPVTLFTGSVGRYSGNYWYSLRPFIRDKPTGLSASAGLTARRYYVDADNYIGARVSYGSSPGDNALVDQLGRASSLTAGVHGSRGSMARRIWTWSATFEREELSPDRFRNRWEIGSGVKFRY